MREKKWKRRCRLRYVGAGTRVLHTTLAIWPCDKKEHIFSSGYEAIQAHVQCCNHTVLFICRLQNIAF